MPSGEGIGAGLGGAALGAIPVIGSMGSAMLQQHYALKNWHRTNAYNHPREQVKRNKEAGLPLAAMFSGSGGSTSQAPSTPNIDPSLGTAQGLEKYFTNRMQKKQIELIDQQIREATASADIKAGEAQWKKLGSPGTELIPGGIQFSNQVVGLEAEQKAKVAQAKTAEVMADLARAKTQAEIDHVLQTIKLGMQQHEWNELKQYVDKWIKNRLDNNGFTTLEGIFYKFFLQPK